MTYSCMYRSSNTTLKEFVWSLDAGPHKTRLLDGVKQGDLEALAEVLRQGCRRVPTLQGHVEAWSKTGIVCETLMDTWIYAWVLREWGNRLGEEVPKGLRFIVFMYASTVKKVFGLTNNWMKKLGEPDKHIKNPHYSSGSTSALYRRARVASFILDHWDEYTVLRLQQQERKDKALQKKAAQKRHQQKFQQQVEDFIQNNPVCLEQLPEDLDVFVQKVASTLKDARFLTMHDLVLHLSMADSNVPVLLTKAMEVFDAQTVKCIEEQLYAATLTVLKRQYTLPYDFRHYL